MIKEITNLRLKIDGISQLVKDLKFTGEIESSYDSLILAKAWLGKILGELGTETPYKKDGERKTVEDIEETSDVNDQVVHSDKSHIEKVDWLREEIKKIINTSADISEIHPHIELEQGFVYKYLCEARFWLGFELQRIKKQE